MGDPRAIEPIEKALEDRSSYVRKQAERSLDKLRKDLTKNKRNLT